MFQNKIKLILLAIIIFIISAVVWYLPLPYKGYAPQPVSRELVLARNLHFAQTPAIENEKGAYLNSVLAKEQGREESYANRLTAKIYSWIYDRVGFSRNTAQYIAILAFALINVILFLFIINIFNLKIGLIFSSVTIFTPVIWQMALTPAFYEWALLFFVLGFICYWLRQGKNLLLLFLAGIFFSLAILSRTAFFISVAAIGLFELVSKKSLKRLIVFGLPIFLIVVLPFLISYFQGGSLYTKKDAYVNYGHCFPDSYTFYFDKENYIQSIAKTARGDVLSCLGEHGYKIKLTYHLKMMAGSFKYYIRESIRLITFGGPLIWFFVMLGVFQLKKKKPEMLKLFYFWLPIWFIGLIIVESSNWDHLLEIWLAVAILTSLGIYYLGNILVSHLEIINSKNKSSTFVKVLDKKFLFLSICYLLLIAHLILSSKWMFHEEYDTSSIVKELKSSQLINQFNVPQDSIIAVDGHSLAMLNYFTDRTFIMFSTQTINKLLSENKLKDAFDEFGVTHVVGYDEELNKKIIEQTNRQVIY